MVTKYPNGYRVVEHDSGVFVYHEDRLTGVFDDRCNAHQYAYDQAAAALRNGYAVAEENGVWVVVAPGGYRAYQSLHRDDCIEYVTQRIEHDMAALGYVRMVRTRVYQSTKPAAPMGPNNIPTEYGQW